MNIFFIVLKMLFIWREAFISFNNEMSGFESLINKTYRFYCRTPQRKRNNTI